nr:putative late blight resistance protein homolog R1B-8 [Ipomoea batatas]
MAIVFDKVVEDVASKVVNKFVQTVAANIELVSGIGPAIADLTSDIETFNARLVDVSKNQDICQRTPSSESRAQDAVAKYIALNKKHQDNAVAKYLDKLPVPVYGNINVCAKEIQSIRGKMNKLLQTHEKDLISYMNYRSMGQDNDMKPLQPIVEEGNETGFEDQVESLIRTRLTGPSNNFIVIPIVGMPGTGKTTFAYQIFDSTNKLNMFVHTIWIHVSHSFNRKQKYIDILCGITKHSRDTYSRIDENQLAGKIRDHLKDKKYFIVLDDIWEKSHWDSLNDVLPKTSQGSRVLVTTRFLKVVDSDEKPHILEPLNHKVSWKILEKIVFGKDGCPANEALKTLGKDIAKRCNGLPLSLVMVGGILRKSRAHDYWKRVAGNPFQEINRKDQSYNKSDIDLKQEELIAIPNAFPLLRVLDIESFKLSFQLPDELFSLNLLKYLAITTNVNILPKAFKNLSELQTLVIKTKEGTVLEINGAGIWNMEKLRHVQTNASMQLPSPPQKTWRQKNTGKTNIRTLSSISPTSCTKMMFSKTPHLKKLGVRGNLAELLEENEEICLFNNLQMLKCLENLKLYGQDENELKVPMLDKFAHRLRKLTFCKTFFKWDDMRILGSLEELEVLKLDENAVRGEHWDLKSDVVFNQLQYLRIGRTNLKTWTIMENSFPILENLVLRNCTNLEAIPFEFAQVHNLKVIELYHMSENAINSATQLDKQRRGNENDKGLDLKITPLPPKATVHEEKTHDEEIFHSSRFDLSSSSILLPPLMVHGMQTHDDEIFHSSRFDLSSSSILLPPLTVHEDQTHDEENVHTSRFDLSSSSILLPQVKVPEEQTHDEENVHTSRFDLPSSSILLPPLTVHEDQTHDEENVHTSRFDLSSSSILLPQVKVPEEQTHDEENVHTSRFDLPSSSILLPPLTVHEDQTLSDEENVHTSRFDLSSSSILLP